MDIGGGRGPKNIPDSGLSGGKRDEIVMVPPPTLPSSVSSSERPRATGAFDECETNAGAVGGDSRGPMTSAQIQAQLYLNDKKIFELFNFMIGHLLVDEPSDPIEYLGDLLDKCMLFRAGLGDPPLLFSSRHVESMFRSLDPGGLGNISLDQYKTGMTTLGIGCYEANPEQYKPGRVDKNTFETEATRCLVNMLAEMVGKKS